MDLALDPAELSRGQVLPPARSTQVSLPWYSLTPSTLIHPRRSKPFTLGPKVGYSGRWVVESESWVCKIHQKSAPRRSDTLDVKVLC